MKILMLVLSIAAFSVSSFGQLKKAEDKETPKIVVDAAFSVKDMGAVLAKAKWLELGTSQSETAFSIDTYAMIRVDEIVSFRERYVKDGETAYDTYSGNCTESTLRRYNRFVMNPGENQLMKVEIESEWKPAAEGTFADALLNYACEYATVVR